MSAVASSKTRVGAGPLPGEAMTAGRRRLKMAGKKTVAGPAEALREVRKTAAPAQPVGIDAEFLALAVKSIRWALVIGQQSLCELERLGSACGPNTPLVQRPIHPTGSDDTHAELADALRWIETLAADVEILPMAVKSIRWALVIGQQSLCELERLERVCEPSTPSALRPIHPNGGDDTHAKLADAMRWVETFAADESATSRPPESVDGHADRSRLALEACFEVSALAGLLAKRSHCSDDPDFATRGVAIRMRALAEVVIAALGDPMDEPAAMRARMFGGILDLDNKRGVAR